MSARDLETQAVVKEMEALGLGDLPLRYPRLYWFGWSFKGPDEPVDQWKARMLERAAKEPTA